MSTYRRGIPREIARGIASRSSINRLSNGFELSIYHIDLFRKKSLRLYFGKRKLEKEKYCYCVSLYVESLTIFFFVWNIRIKIVFLMFRKRYFYWKESKYSMLPFNPTTNVLFYGQVTTIRNQWHSFKKKASWKKLRCVLTHINNPSSRLNFILRFGNGNTKRKDVINFLWFLSISLNTILFEIYL